jgi:hypothetical protein
MVHVEVQRRHDWPAPRHITWHMLIRPRASLFGIHSRTMMVVVAENPYGQISWTRRRSR